MREEKLREGKELGEANPGSITFLGLLWLFGLICLVSLKGKKKLMRVRELDSFSSKEVFGPLKGRSSREHRDSQGR